MKILRMLMVFCVPIQMAAAAKVEPSLPSWREGERAGLEKAGWVAGGRLLADDPLPVDSPEKVKKQLITVAEPTAGEVAETESTENEIPEKYWQAYFARRPEGFLVDPQGLLSPEDYRDRLGFLNYHSGDSSIDLFVYVFKRDQEIPGEVREEELVERFFSEGRPAAAVYYFMGAPQRSVLYLSPSLVDAVPVAEQRRAVESSVIQALKDVGASKQIEDFLVQMSIRIYWMERMLNGTATGEEDVRVASRGSIPEKVRPTTADKLEPLLEHARPYSLPVGIAGCGLLMGLAIRSCLRRRVRYRFPEFEVEPRLGGSHAAGVGAVISFASAALPPASQRDQVPDYLRRA